MSVAGQSNCVMLLFLNAEAGMPSLALCYCFLLQQAGMRQCGDLSLR